MPLVFYFGFSLGISDWARESKSTGPTVKTLTPVGFCFGISTPLCDLLHFTFMDFECPNKGVFFLHFMNKF